MDDKEFNRIFKGLKDRLEKIVQTVEETDTTFIVTTKFGDKEVSTCLLKETMKELLHMHSQDQETIINHAKLIQKVEACVVMARVDVNEFPDFSMKMYEKLKV